MSRPRGPARQDAARIVEPRSTTQIHHGQDDQWLRNRIAHRHFAAPPCLSGGCLSLALSSRWYSVAWQRGSSVSPWSWEVSSAHWRTAGSTVARSLQRCAARSRIARVVYWRRACPVTTWRFFIPPSTARGLIHERSLLQRKQLVALRGIALDPPSAKSAFRRIDRDLQRNWS